MNVILIAAIAQNGVIGKGLDLPWKLSTDLRRFKRLTMGHPIIMGRKTFQSIGRALPGRTNIVLSRDPTWAAPDTLTASSFDDALRAAAGSGKVFVIGGASLFAEALPRASVFYHTEVIASPQGDVFFPVWSPRDWFEYSYCSLPASPTDSHATVYRVLHRRSPSVP